jgi:hypothetical protein
VVKRSSKPLPGLELQIIQPIAQHYTISYPQLPLPSVPKLIIHVAIPPLPHMASWCEVEKMWEDLKYNGGISSNSSWDGIGQWTHMLKLRMTMQNITLFEHYNHTCGISQGEVCLPIHFAVTISES